MYLRTQAKESVSEGASGRGASSGSAPDTPDLVEPGNEGRARRGGGRQGHSHGRQNIFGGWRCRALAAGRLLRRLPAGPAVAICSFADAVTGAEVGVFCDEGCVHVFVLRVGAPLVGAAFRHAWGAERHAACTNGKASRPRTQDKMRSRNVWGGGQNAKPPIFGKSRRVPTPQSLELTI